MNEWIELAKNYGLPGLIILAFGAFWYLKVWPLLIRQLDDAKVERETQGKRFEEQGKLFTEALKLERDDNSRRFDEQGRLFMEALRRQNVLAAETHKEITEELRSIGRPERSIKKQTRKR
jgi:hypothetical protein